MCNYKYEVAKLPVVIFMYQKQSTNKYQTYIGMWYLMMLFKDSRIQGTLKDLR